jgi:hypothetical protein
MQKFAVAFCAVLFPLLTLACEVADRNECKETIKELVGYRTQAIQNAFGDVFGAIVPTVQIEFISSKDPRHEIYSGRVAYDVEASKLIVPRRHMHAKLPRPLTWATAYWPYYKKDLYRETFPVIEAIDNALWGVYLQEAASAQGLRWPHEECGSLELSERLPCEMLVHGIGVYLTEIKSSVFNTNRLDRIWPEDFSTFERTVWRRGEQAYLDVQRYGGILLLKPLIGEFGVPNALAYVAQNPFRLEQGNLHRSALRYQERAREALTSEPARPAAPKVTLQTPSLQPAESILISAHRMH